LLRLPPPVLPALGDELLLAPSELDLVHEGVLLDRPLLLDRHRPARERGLIRLLLDLLAHRGFERLLEIRRRLHRRDPDGRDLDPERREPRVGAEPGLDPLANPRVP